MSSRPWKNVNSRTKTNSIDVIHCDELITDELNTKNLDLNITATVRREVNTNSFDISNVNISEEIKVPDLCVNIIGSESSYIEFINPLSAPISHIDKIIANDSSFLEIELRSQKINLKNITNIDNSSIIFNSDVSFNKNIISNNKTKVNNIFNDVSLLTVHSDVSVNNCVMVNSISLEILEAINNGTITIVNDISVRKINICHDVSVGELVDTSIISLDFIDDLSFNKIIFHDDTNFDTSLSINDLFTNNIHSSTTFNEDVDISGSISVGGNIKVNEINMGTGTRTFTKNVHFKNVTCDLCVNNICLFSDQSLVIDSDVSINNTTALDICSEQINIMQFVTDSNKNKIRNNSLLLINDVIVFRGGDNRRFFNFIESEDSNVPAFTNVELFESSNAVIDFSNVTLKSSPAYTDLCSTDQSMVITTVNDISFNINIRHDVSYIYRFDFSYASGLSTFIIPTFNKIIHSETNNKFHTDFSYIQESGTDSKQLFYVTPTDVLGLRFDLSYDQEQSFYIKIQNLLLEATNLITIKLINNKQPEWNFIKLTPSNGDLDYDPSSNDQSWNNAVWYSDNVVNEPDKTIDESYTINVNEGNNAGDISYLFYVQYMNNSDSSYYHLDLSSIDPEHFDVSYDLSYDKTLSLFNDWSFNFSDTSKIDITIPGIGKNGSSYDVSFEIISKDDYITRSIYQKKIVNFKKINRPPEWREIKLTLSSEDQPHNEEEFLTTYIDQSLTDFNSNSDYSFNLYYNYANSPFIYRDLSTYVIDLSAIDPELFRVTFPSPHIDLGADISITHLTGNTDFSMYTFVDNSVESFDVSVKAIDDFIDRKDSSLNIRFNMIHNLIDEISFNIVKLTNDEVFLYNLVDVSDYRILNVNSYSDSSFEIGITENSFDKHVLDVCSVILIALDIDDLIPNVIQDIRFVPNSNPYDICYGFVRNFETNTSVESDYISKTSHIKPLVIINKDANNVSDNSINLINLYGISFELIVNHLFKYKFNYKIFNQIKINFQINGMEGNEYILDFVRPLLHESHTISHGEAKTIVVNNYINKGAISFNVLDSYKVPLVIQELSLPLLEQGIIKQDIFDNTTGILELINFYDNPSSFMMITYDVLITINTKTE